MLVKDGRYLAKRIDSTDPISLPIGSGISGIVVASSTAVTTTGLAVDPGASAGPTPTAPFFTVVATVTPSASSTQSVVVSKSIPVSTVIGSCIGAFIFVSALIVFVFWFYRRYSESLKKQALARRRRRPWNKLEDDGDKWENMDQTNQTKEVDQVVPMEKLTMFKRAASVRTAYTQKSVDDHTLAYPQSFAPFDANLVRTLSADIDPKSQPSHIVNSVKGQTPNPSSNSLGESLSSSPNMAIPTPEATFLQSHRWESAEVVQYEGPSAEVVEPSAQDKEIRSMHNPFFGSQEYIRSRSNSHTEDKSPNAKGKERMHDSMSSSILSSDPFEALVAQLPKPVLTHHQPSDSSASAESKTRALQTLMGALELSEDEIRERLRVASMQPSDFSTPIHEEFMKTREP
jgi:hypothetical protein